MKPIKVGVLGLGTVGGGTVNILKRNAAEIARRAGREIIITRASARDLQKPRICDTQDIQLTTDPLDIINDPDIDIIVETIGGAGTVKDMILTAIANGKHIVTANKSLIATHGNEIFAKASEQGVIVAFEAAVAGGIPIIKAIREGLSGNQIQWVAGIINGTGNFILTEMRDKGRDFADVLAEAQALGYAEADPTFDVEGIDAGHKLTILASIAFGIPLQFEKVYTEGITEIARIDVEYAEQLGYRIKHLGIARKTAEGIELRVHPTLIPERRLIANVNGVMNAVLVKGDAVGATLYYGAGAGAEPTGSSVVADVIDVVRALTSDPENRVPHLAFRADALADIPVLSAERIKTSYYLRLNAEDKPGVLADVTKILADHDISIEAIIQKEPPKESTALPIIMLTQITLEQEMNAAIRAIEALPTVSGKVNRIRMETLG
ncbi:homoserine dehydrogenase [Methylovulum psychrotolerans]|uniref:Homoserine dehydrogenase n=1 Tax=Methylovulum psychrotolerans TaxID=1704499 RepID=A0A1Z4C515_9GAMM|nr:homoserine dehydrogenase [Methylovulum psychrotolerans]ASF48627.1 homoserine dehydrogenase [Methylovulum psychrotolerans]